MTHQCRDLIQRHTLVNEVLGKGVAKHVRCGTLQARQSSQSGRLIFDAKPTKRFAPLIDEKRIVLYLRTLGEIVAQRFANFGVQWNRVVYLKRSWLCIPR